MRAITKLYYNETLCNENNTFWKAFTLMLGVATPKIEF